MGTEYDYGRVCYGVGSIDRYLSGYELLLNVTLYNTPKS